MARPVRADYPNTFYHVLSRGVERRRIFQDSKDHERFLQLLGSLSERFGQEVWAYVLMGNHYHLVLRTSDANLSRGMQWLGVAYSAYFNRKYGREGHLFQGRFKSFLIEEEEYLEQLLLYVHRNPLRAGVVERLADYRWSSYRCLGYGKDCLDWLASEKVLRLFGGRDRFRRRIQAYSEEEDRLLENLKFGLLLGGEVGVRKLREKLGSGVVREQPQGRQLSRSVAVGEILERFRDELGLKEEEWAELRKPIRRRRRPLRDVLIYLVWRGSHETLGAIGEYFGVGYTTIANARTRGEAHLQQDRKLRRKLGKVLP